MRRIGLAVVLVIGLALTWSATESQQTRRVWRIGHLAQGAASDPGDASGLAGFRQGLQEREYVEGRNLIIEYRWAELSFDRLPALAAELVELKVDLIAALATRASLAAKQATSTIPVVMTLSLHAVESGLVQSLAHPGGNVTGMTGMSDQTITKRVELLKETLPRLSRIAVLWNPVFYDKKPEPQWRALEVAAPRMGVTLESVAVRSVDDFEGAFTSAARRHASAVVVFPDPVTVRHRDQLAKLSAKYQLPTIHQDRESVAAGALMSYGFSFFESGRRAAYFVDRIFKGAKPADLPVEQPTKFELVINLKTAKALGLTVPQSVLVRADEIIQ